MSPPPYVRRSPSATLPQLGGAAWPGFFASVPSSGPGQGQNQGQATHSVPLQLILYLDISEQRTMRGIACCG